MNTYDGTFEKPQRTQPNGMARPNLASGPSNGWKMPSYGSVSLYFSCKCTAAISGAVIEVLFTKI